MRIQVTTPTRGQLDHEFLESVDKLIYKARAPGATFQMDVVRMYGCSLIDHARSRLATSFLESDADVLVWIDDDMVFDADECLAICREALERKAIVGAVCSTRGVLGKITAKFGEDVEKIGFYSQGQIYECVSIGCGLTAVHRSVFEKLRDSGEVPICNTAGDGSTSPIIPFYMTICEEGVWWGEDTSFCVRARRQGVPVFVDTRARVGHKGSYVYHIEDTQQAVTLFGGMRATIKQPTPKAAE